MKRVVGSVGTDHHPFPRFLDWVGRASEELSLDALVQRGATPARPGLTTVEFMSADDLFAHMRDADAVICHGGPGTISAAVRSGHRPIVIARDPELGEHVDDHQQRYTRRLREEGRLDAPQSYEELVGLLRAERPRADAPGADGVERSALAFGALVDDLLAGTIASRPLRARFLVRRVP